MSQGSTGSTWPHRDPNNGLLWRIEEDLSRTYYNPTSKSIKVPVKDTHKWTGPGDLTYSARGQLVQPRTTISIGGDAQSTSDIHTSGSDNSSGSSSNGRNNVHIATKGSGNTFYFEDGRLVATNADVRSVSAGEAQRMVQSRLPPGVQIHFEDGSNGSSSQRPSRSQGG